ESTIVNASPISTALARNAAANRNPPLITRTQADSRMPARLPLTPEHAFLCLRVEVAEADPVDTERREEDLEAERAGRVGLEVVAVDGKALSAHARAFVPVRGPVERAGRRPA